MSSFGERKAKDLLEKSPVEWIKHNRRQLSRIYPAGRRTDSSNYEPMPMWLCGNQSGEETAYMYMYVYRLRIVYILRPYNCIPVALNYQTPDEDMHIYKGFFLDNGGCGYVLKPEFLRHGSLTNVGLE